MVTQSPARKYRVLISLRNWLSRPSIVVWAGILGAGLALPSLWIGINADDFYLRAHMFGFPGMQGLPHSPFQCFTFADGVQEHNARRMSFGLLPWWASPEVRIAFFRPLSSLSHWFDFRFLHPHAWLMHLQNLLWYGLLCAAAAVLYRRMMVGAAAAGLAAVLYAVDDAHSIPVGWISNRNALLTTLFCVLALIAHDKWRRDRWRPGALLGTLSLAIAFACGEAAAGVAGYLFAYMICLDSAPWRRRIASMAPYAVVAAVWVAVYTQTGFGTRHSALYADPVGSPVAFIGGVARHLPVLIHGQFGLIPANIYVLFLTHGQLVLTLVGLLFTLALGVALYPDIRHNRTAQFWALGALVATIPVSAAIPSERLLCLTGLGGMGLVAQFLERMWTGAAISSNVSEKVCGAGFQPAPQRSKFEKVFAGLFVGTHAVLAPLSMPFASASVTIFQNILTGAEKLLPSGPEIEDKSFIFINAPFEIYAGSMPILRSSRREPIQKHTWTLTTGCSTVSVKRHDEYTLDIRTEGGFFPDDFGITFYDPIIPYKIGDAFTTEDFTAEVLSAVNPFHPEELRFRFRRSLEDASYCWFYIEPVAQRTFVPPRIGETIVIPGGHPFIRLMKSQMAAVE